uniref:Telomeric repeat-binding factor 1 n=1 Tax=Cairina moschata TaxID=8855 RepID=A0A8C3GDV5_CAIMO
MLPREEEETLGLAGETQLICGSKAVINGFSKIATHQKKMVYLCQLLIRIANGKKLECNFEEDPKISPLESALSYWTLLEREESKFDKLHEDIRRLIQIQVVAVHMEKRYFKEAAEALERMFTDSESDKPLRGKLTTIIKSKDPYIPLLQSFNYDLLISKVKSYVKRFMNENEKNFLLQAAMEQVESKGLEAVALQNITVSASEEEENNLETTQRFTEEQPSTTNPLPEDAAKSITRRCSMRKFRARSVLQSVNSLQNVEEVVDSQNSGRRRQPWTLEEDKKLKSGVREFGVGNWAKILVHGDFSNRTSVMLKDRWRTLSKIKSSKLLRKNKAMHKGT